MRNTAECPNCGFWFETPSTYPPGVARPTAGKLHRVQLVTDFLRRQKAPYYVTSKDLNTWLREVHGLVPGACRAVGAAIREYASATIGHSKRKDGGSYFYWSRTFEHRVPREIKYSKERRSR